jgi:hypothetical protein
MFIAGRDRSAPFGRALKAWLREDVDFARSTCAGRGGSVRGKALSILLIRGGLIEDGSGGEPFRGDVGIVGNKITAVGEVRGDAAESIDATGRIVTPGFVDVHTPLRRSDHVGEHVGILQRACKSWFFGANVPGKPAMFMMYFGGLATYHERCRQVAQQGYRGFTFTKRDPWSSSQQRGA